MFTPTQKTIGRFTFLGTFDSDLTDHKLKMSHLFLGVHSLKFSC